MKKDYNQLLYDKMKSEYDEFISDLSTKSPKEIIDHSYEKVFKEELLIICESSDRTQEEAKALYQQKRPLDFLYQEWLHNEYSYMDMVRDTVDDGAKSAVKAMKEFSNALKEIYALAEQLQNK